MTINITRYEENEKGKLYTTYDNYRPLDTFRYDDLFNDYDYPLTFEVICRKTAKKYVEVDVKDISDVWKKQMLGTSQKVGILLDSDDFPVAFTMIGNVKYNENTHYRIFSKAYHKYFEHGKEGINHQITIWFNQELILKFPLLVSISNDKFIIRHISENEIMFSNNKKITYDHIQDCCEHNYADFLSIDDTVLDYIFTEPLTFEEVEGYGFRFGNKDRMISVPCYSEQNGYYTTDLSIYYDIILVIRDLQPKVEIY